MTQAELSRLCKVERAVDYLLSLQLETVEKSYKKACEAEDEEGAAELARRKRRYLLEQSDTEMIPDRPTDKDAWAVYRQHLRDIPEQSGFPFDIDWGTAPIEG